VVIVQKILKIVYLFFKNKNYYYKKVYLNKFSVQKTTTIKTPIYIEN